MKDRILTAMLVLGVFALVGAGMREYLIHNGRLTSDLNADGHSITNLPDGFFPTNGFLRTHQDISGKADKSDTYTKSETDAKIVELAPAPGNYSVVSNAAMSAAAATNDFLRLTGGTLSGDLFSIVSDIGVRDSVGGFLALRADAAGAFFWYRNGFSGADSPIYRICLPDSAGFIALRSDLAAAADDATNYTDWAIQNIDPAIPVFDVYAADVTNVAEAVTSNAISTNNAAFVEAVRSTPLAGADPSDLSEIGEYGSYGTVGAAILALIAGLAALKRRIGTAETAISGLAPKYPMVPVTPSGGTLTVTPYIVATYTAGDSAAAFTVAVGTGTAGKARDCELVIDCTGSGAVAPTVTWPSSFHPRTDAATDFACEAGVRNVYFISEFSTGEFAVGGWQETAGGNA